MSEVDPRGRLLEMGADSLILLEAVRKIEHTYGIHLTMQQMFEDLSTLEALAGYIDRTLPAGITGIAAEPIEEEKIVIHSPPAIPVEAIGPVLSGHNGVHPAPSGGSIERIMAQQLDVLSRIVLTVEALRSNGHGLSLEAVPAETTTPALRKTTELHSTSGDKETPKSEPFSPYRPVKAGPVRE